jgi:hypothetical protein
MSDQRPYWLLKEPRTPGAPRYQQPLRHLSCEVCGKAFETRKPHSAKFCGRKCHDTHWRRAKGIKARVSFPRNVRIHATWDDVDTLRKADLNSLADRISAALPPREP